MRLRVQALTVWLTIGALLTSSPAWAQQHIADPAAMEGALADKAATDTAARQVLERVLTRPDVQAAAARMGVDLKQARTALADLTSEELQALVQPAQAVDADRAGGQTTIVISITTLLLIIIIVLLVAD